MRQRDVMQLLRQRGAADLDHPGGDLLSHLARTGDRLERWGASDALVTAGRWHAAYGTDQFQRALFDFDERAIVVDEIGDEAESIVYRFCRCDRDFVYPQIGRERPVQFRDRLTGAVDDVAEPAVRTFAELTVANELDVLTHNGALRPADRAVKAARFEAWSTMLTAEACADLRAIQQG